MKVGLMCGLFFVISTVAVAAKPARVNLAPVPVPGAMVDDRYSHLRLPEAYGSARARKPITKRDYRKHKSAHRKSHRRSLVRQSVVAATKPHPKSDRLTHALPATATVIGGRPAGCPHRFCGCALALKIFGRIIPVLNLAANWLTFPRAAPAPGMVAARRGHVFQLLAHSRGNRWRVFDPNSGHGRIRIHDRSIAGYAIVNPRRSVRGA